ncbi:ABC transporter permease [Flavitalea sp.]|nr:ABC transporter permease [Flavitalea sp.]
MKKQPTPPPIFQSFFRWFCRRKLHDSIEGDLIELYQERVRANGKRKADLLFMIDVLLLLRPGIIRSIRQPVLHYQNPSDMIKHYWKTGWRRLALDKGYSAINIAGLSIGLAACMLIIQYVNFELSFDEFHKNKNNIYRVLNDRFQEGKRIQHGPMTYSAISKALKDDYAEVAEYTRVTPYRVEVMTYGETKIANQRAIAVDNSFLSMFSYPLIAGNPQTALQEPNSIILTESLAANILGARQDAASVLGKLIIFDRDSVPYKITGVMKDVPANSYLQLNLLLSYVSLYSASGNNRWTASDYSFTESTFWHYVRLKEGTDYRTLEAKLPAFSRRHFDGTKVSGSDEKFYLQPLSKMHLYSDFEYEIGKTGSAVTVWGLLLTAIFIMLIAWVNYINLTTARSAQRAREVGVRKISGAYKYQLVWQFLTESFIVNTIAIMIALLLVRILQGNFNSLVQQQDLSITSLFTKGIAGYGIISGLAVLVIIGILVSGLYPSLVFSSFKPIEILKGRFVHSGKGILLRNGLVVGQFAITLVLMIGSLIVYRQVNFMSQQQPGMNMDQVLIVKGPVLTPFDSTFAGKANTFVERLKQLPHVKAVSISGRIPGDELGRAFNVYRTDHTDTKIALGNMGVDKDFIDLYSINLLEGRNFSITDYNFDLNKVHNTILNESACRQFGFSEPGEAVGKSIMMFNRKWDVIGVIADFHQKSLRYPLEPVALMPTNQGTYSRISVKVDTEDLVATVDAIKNEYAVFFPGNIYDYYFLNEWLNRQYKNDALFGRVFALFAVLAIFIACLGLLGLSLFSTAQRVKEISIRKVMGASVAGIVLLLSRDFIRLVTIAFVIASPIAYFIMHTWLQDFAYRIPVSWWIFALAGLCSIAIALITISFQTVRAARSNPVTGLRAE